MSLTQVFDRPLQGSQFFEELSRPRLGSGCARAQNCHPVQDLTRRRLNLVPHRAELIDRRFGLQAAELAPARSSLMDLARGSGQLTKAGAASIGQ